MGGDLTTEGTKSTEEVTEKQNLCRVGLAHRMDVAVGYIQMRERLGVFRLLERSCCAGEIADDSVDAEAVELLVFLLGVARIVGGKKTRLVAEGPGTDK